MEAAELGEIACRAYDDGIRTVMIQGGDHLDYDMEGLAEAVKRIRNLPGATVLLCIGDHSLSVYARLFDAGAEQAIVKFETSNDSVYRTMRPHSSLSQRLELIESLHRMGYRMSSGFILGLPDTDSNDTERDLNTVRNLPLFAASVSPFIPNDMSPVACEVSPSLDRTLECISRLRLGGPGLWIPSVSALNLIACDETRVGGGQISGLNAGANVLTVNYTPTNAQADFLIYSSRRSIIGLRAARDAAIAAGLQTA